MGCTRSKVKLKYAYGCKTAVSQDISKQKLRNRINSTALNLLPSVTVLHLSLINVMLVMGGPPWSTSTIEDAAPDIV